MWKRKEEEKVGTEEKCGSGFRRCGKGKKWKRRKDKKETKDEHKE